LVNFGKLNYADLLIRFRQMEPVHQAAIAGMFFLVVYVPYSYFLLRLNLAESIIMAVTSSILFMVVYYFTSYIIMRKSKKLANQSLGPKKGLRNK
jgi:hypothetical protein